MINLNTVSNVAVVGHSKNYQVAIKFLRRLLAPREISGLNISLIPTDGTEISGGGNEPPFEEAGPLVRKLEHKFDSAPDTLFLLDGSNNSASTLARLHEGPWKGFPWSQQMIAF